MNVREMSFDDDGINNCSNFTLQRSKRKLNMKMLLLKYQESLTQLEIHLVTKENNI